LVLRSRSVRFDQLALEVAPLARTGSVTGETFILNDHQEADNPGATFQYWRDSGLTIDVEQGQTGGVDKYYETMCGLAFAPPPAAVWSSTGCARFGRADRNGRRDRVATHYRPGSRSPSHASGLDRHNCVKVVQPTSPEAPFRGVSFSAHALSNSRAARP
jgi:hypothetical protein